MNIKKLTTPLYGTNCYLLENATAAAVIDPGEITPELLAFAEEQKDKPTKLILLTHCHFDHIGGVGAVKSVWNAPVVIGAMDKEGLIDNRINLSGIWTEERISIRPDIAVIDGDTVQLGECFLKVIATAGHTAGSVCYLWNDVLFAGDTLFRCSIGRTDLPTGDVESLSASLKALSVLDKNVKVLPGHGPSTTIGYEIEYNPYI